MTLICLPIAVFVAAVVWVWVAGRGDVTPVSQRTMIGGSVGLVSAIVTAYLVHDRSQKFADAATNTQTINVAVALLLAHAALFFVLLLRRA